MGSRDAALVDDMAELKRALDLLGQDFIDKVTTKLQDRHRDDNDSSDVECAICFEPFEHEHDERVTECFHSFCKDCTEELFNSPVRTADLTEAQQADGMRQCPMCRAALSRKCTFRASAFFNPVAEAEEADKGSPSFSGKRPVSPRVHGTRRTQLSHLSETKRSRTSNRTPSDECPPRERARRSPKPSPRIRSLAGDRVSWTWMAWRSSLRPK